MNRQIPFLTLLIQGFLGLPNHNDKRFYKNLCLDSWATFTLFPYQKKKKKSICQLSENSLHFHKAVHLKEI